MEIFNSYKNSWQRRISFRESRHTHVLSLMPIKHTNKISIVGCCKNVGKSTQFKEKKRLHM